MAMVVFYVVVVRESGSSFGAMFAYFPFIVDQLIMLVFLLLIIFNSIDLRKGVSGLPAGLWMPFGLGVVFLALVSIVGYFGYMIPFAHADFGIRELTIYLGFSSLMVVDWLLFEEKGTVHYTIIPFWIFFLMIYVAFIMMRPYIWGESFLPNGTYYPYSFLDFDRWGALIVWSWTVLAAFLAVALAIGLISLNDLIAGKYKRRFLREDETPE